MSPLAPACLCAAVLTAATSAGASPVTLEFDGILEFVQRVEDERPVQYSARRTYFEKGYAIDLSWYPDFQEHVDGTLGLKDTWTGAANLFFDIGIRREDGGRFSFDNFVLAKAFSNLIGWYSSAGGPPFFEEVLEEIYWPALEITGVPYDLPEGSMLVERMTPFGLPVGETISPALDFGNLRSLEFNFVQPERPWNYLACAEDNLARVSPQAAALCANAYVSDDGGRNDTGYLRFERLTLSGPADQVTPVPLPAGLPMMLTMLTCLAGFRRWAAAQARN